MNVGIWIRVSTDDQAKGESPKTHEARARMYSELKNWAVLEMYDLSGVSGKSIIDHPECKRMLRDVSTGKIEALIFSKLARLARNTRELLEISDHFQQYDASLVSLGESIDTSSPAGRLLFTVIGALGEWEREEISARVSASVVTRANQGKCTGGVGPFGYVWKDNTLIVNPDEASVIKEVFSTFTETGNMALTARMMNERGYRTKEGAKFKNSTIKRILTNTAYKGQKRANYSKSKGNKKSWKWKPESEWVYQEIEPIVDNDTWNKVNVSITIKAKNYVSNPQFNGKYLFAGLLKCECGQKMYVTKYKAMKIPRYVCRGCRSKINEDVILGLFKDCLKSIVLEPDKLNDAIKSDDNFIEQQTKQQRLLNTELKNVEKKIDSLLELWSDKAIVKSTFTEKYRDLCQRKEQLEDEIPRNQAKIDHFKITETGKDYILSQTQFLYSLWDTLTVEEKEKIIRELVDEITVKKDELKFQLFYLPEIMNKVTDSATMSMRIQY
jgi:site-specific DNA recombinase